ncbi:hypothetical protein [Paenibacillus roseus]|uniref:hypothetical protein n=2 Tax=Paenibacillus TaxID=44249 RepID=UPI001E3CD02F|nr:hypothetical protein [Paenibacillus roseus]
MMNTIGRNTITTISGIVTSTANAIKKFAVNVFQTSRTIIMTILRIATVIRMILFIVRLLRMVATVLRIVFRLLWRVTDSTTAMGRALRLILNIVRGIALIGRVISGITAVIKGTVFVIGSLIGGMFRLVKGILNMVAGLNMGSKLQTGFEKALDFGKQAVAAANERIQAEQQLQSIMGNTNGQSQGSINMVEDQADKLSLVTGINANTGIAGQAQLAQYVKGPENIAALTEPLYNMATEMFGINIDQDQIKEAADLMGRAMNGELDSITRNGKALGSMFTDAERNLFSYGTEAERTALLIQALNKDSEGLAREMGKTPEGQFRIIQNILQSIKETIGLGILPGLMGIADLLINAYASSKFDGLINAIVGGFTLIIDAVTWVAQVLLDNWDMVLNGLTALGIAAAIFAAIWLVQWMIAMWPLLLIIGVILLIINVLNSFGVSTGEIIAYVVGGFMAMFGMLYNAVALLWNLLVSFAEFLINLFIDPTFAIQKLFYDLQMTFLEYMYKMALGTENFAGSFMSSIIGAVNSALKAFNWLTGKMNKIFGTEIDQVELFDEQNVHAISDRIKGMMDKLQKPVSTKDTVDLSGSKMNYGNWNDQFNQGFNATSNLSNSLGDINADKFLSGTSKQGNWAATDNNKNIDQVNRVNTLGGIDEKVDISSEDLKVMRDLAEMKAIQNFVTLTPTVQVTTGDIRNGDDADTMIGKIEQILVNQISSTASGAYG